MSVRYYSGPGNTAVKKRQQALGWVERGPPTDGHVLIPRTGKHVMLPGKGNEGCPSADQKIGRYLGSPGWPYIIMRVPERRRGRQERQSQGGHVLKQRPKWRMEEGHGPMSVGHLYKLEKAKETDSPLEPPEKNQVLPMMLAQ